MMRIVFGQLTTFTYTNHRGETAVRSVIPTQLDYRTSPHHPEPQWLLHGYDLDRKDWRTFALKDIKV